mgnify:CR=1 FL=1
MSRQTKKPLVTQEDLKTLLSYDEDLGIFTWIAKPTRNIVVGARAGSKDNGKQYRYIRINGKLYAEHRLVFLYLYGEWPPCQVDHINGVRDDNRISNLRLAPNNQADNMQNIRMHSDNLVGAKGVSKLRDKFRARICVGYKTLHLGTFSTAAEATSAYETAAKKHHAFSI